jgi:predicted nucleic acid-binding Zn ribbon protein
MEELKEVLTGVLEGLRKKSRQEELEKAQKAWRKAAGPKAVAHTKIVRLTKGVIRVNVDNSAWLFDLNLKKKRILKSLQKAMSVEDIRFQLGEI